MTPANAGLNGKLGRVGGPSSSPFKLLWAALSCVLIAASCSLNDSSGSPTTAQPGTTAAEPTRETSSSTTSDSGAVPDDSNEASELLPGEALFPGSYSSAHSAFEVSLEPGEGFEVGWLTDRELVIESQANTLSSFEAVAFVETDVVVVTDFAGNVQSRQPARSDLTEWVSNLVHSTLVDDGEGRLGGHTGRWWKFETDAPCSQCFYELFSLGEGAWGTRPGTTHKIWALGLLDSVLLIDIEAPTETFDDWERRTMATLFAGMTLRGTSAEERSERAISGEYQVGRIEIVVIDESRPTNAVEAASDLELSNGLILEPSDSRMVPVSIAYPAVSRGYATEMVDGMFPLVIVAPPLGGYGTITELDRALASHGYVVARMHFPESSAPAESFQFVGEQPGDVSAVLDSLLDDSADVESDLPLSLRVSIADQPIGMIGYSLGGTTIYGLIGADCCRDERIDAAISHAGTFHDFHSSTSWGSAPILLIGSERDDVLSFPAITDIADQLGDNGELIAFSDGRHLAWLDPSNANHEASFNATLQFFARWLADES